MKKRFRWKFEAFAALLAISFLISGCSKTDEQEHIKQTIKTVVELQLNAPDEKSLIQNYKDDELFEAYNDYLEETYAPYYTESAFEQSLRTNEHVIFHMVADRFGYELTVKKVEVEQNKETPTNYNFTASLDYVNQNREKKPIELKGIAIMRDDQIAKISYIGDKKTLRGLLDGSLDAE